MNQTKHHWWAQSSAVFVGALTAAQSRVNGQLSATLHNGVEAALVSFGGGLILISAITVGSPAVRRSLRQLRQALIDGTIKWWQCVGGTVGAFFVAVQSHTVPLVGVAIFTIAAVGGQTASSLIVDRLGIGPNGKTALTRNRIAAAVIAVIAVGVAVSNRFDQGSFALAAVLLSLLVGVLVAGQHAINGRVSVAAGNPLAAAFLNFVFGTAALIVVLTFLVVVRGHQLAPLPAGPWWLYLGGVFGTIFIVTAAWVMKPLGALRFALGSVAGQLTGSLLLDIIVPTAGTNISAQLLTGIGMTAFAVVIANVKRKAAPVAPDSVAK